MSLKIAKNDPKKMQKLFKEFKKCIKKCLENFTKITLNIHKYFISFHILKNKKIFFIVTTNHESVFPVVPQ
jgi:hypothetical protein